MSSHAIVSLDAIHKSFGATPVLSSLSLTLQAEQRIALVGENGAGKTTLARIINGESMPDSGTIQCQGIVGYLPQHIAFDPDATIASYIAQAVGQLAEMQQTLTTLEHALATTPDDPDLLTDYGELQAEFIALGGYDLEYRTEQVMVGLAIDYLEPETPMQYLSGGEQTRVALAAVLLKNPDVLILDEPTNHLDQHLLDWLADYLLRYDHAVLLISHDRRFINRVATHVAELDAITRTLTLYHGNYDAYRTEREQRFAAQVAAHEAQQSELKQLRHQIKWQNNNVGKRNQHIESDKLLRNAKIENSHHTRGAKIRDAKQRLEILEADKIDHPGRVWQIAFPFEPLPLGSRYAFQINNLQIAYDERILVKDFSAAVETGERVILVAPNGTGKSSLLQILAGQQAPHRGTVIASPSAQIGYLAQDNHQLDANTRVWDALPAIGDRLSRQAALHRMGLFAPDWLDGQTVGALSVGMQRKLLIARLVMTQANILLLDEPTNHLDLAALEALEMGLQTFEGTVIAASHDQTFIDRIATQIWRITDQGIEIERR